MNRADAKPKRRLRSFARIAGGVVVLLGVLLFPLPVRDTDLAEIVVRDANRLRDVQPVFLDWMRRPFYDAALIARETPKWHLHSDLSLDLIELERSGFQPMTQAEIDELSLAGWYDWYANGNVLLEITDRSFVDGHTERGLRFHVCHGIMGAQGYVVHVYRCLLGTYAWYSTEWES